MLNSKFDLYKSGWLDLVFQDRNKEYGAYYLRQQYAGNMVRAMGITFFSVAVLFGASFVFKSHAAIVVPSKPNDSIIFVTVDPPVKPEVKPSKPSEPPKASEPAKTTAFAPFVVKPDPEAEHIKPNEEITGPIGPVTTDGPDTEILNSTPAIDPGPATAPPSDETVYTTIGLESMPQPVGGEAAWSKFLNKNLRYPNEAQDANASGRVFLSFVIEKDGHLSSINVERAAGHGFDEEALRVLKLAKAWKPGIQNGQPVRVKYTIPINFQSTEQ